MTTQPTGAPCWIELMTSDVKATRKFYSDVFGWHAGAASEEFGGYFMFFLDAAETTPVAGCMAMPPDFDIVDFWSTYLNVADVDAVVARATGVGAEIRQVAMVIADLGRTAYLIDPTGARVGLWQTNTFTGFTDLGPAAKPGMAAYFELHTRDFAGAVSFYRDVIGWDAVLSDEVPGLDYATLVPGSAGAGIMGAADYMGPDEQPSWQIYFACDGVDSTIERILSGGGSVLQPAVDTPFGRQAQVADPTGAVFRLMG